MDHDQYDQDSEYPNPEEGYDEPNGFHDDSYDGNDYDGNDGVDGDGIEYEGNDYDDYRDDQQPPQVGTPNDFDDNPKSNGAPRHVSHIYQDEASEVLDPDPITKYLKSKDPGWDVQPAEPKYLLDLPEDILRLIVKEVRNTQSWGLFCCVLILGPADHSYQRPHLTRLDQLYALQARHSSDLFQVRHCLAGCAYHPHRGKRRCSDVWAVVTLYGKLVCPHHEPFPLLQRPVPSTPQAW